MVPAVYASTAPNCKFFRLVSTGDHHLAGWRWSRERGGGYKGTSLSSSSAGTVILAAMEFGILPSGLVGSNLILWDSSRVLCRCRSFSGERLPPQLHGSRSNCVTKGWALKSFAERFSFDHAGKSGLQVQALRKSLTGVMGCRRRLRVRATDDAEKDPLGEGYWDGTEGKQQLNDIEDMKELIAEAENLRMAETAEGRPGELTSEDTEKQRADKLREELARRAKQQAEQRKQAEIMFGMGQRAYGRGVYDKSVELLEAALSNVPRSSNLGGEIQIWLAMAYEAHNRHGDCIALYRRIEASHPNKQIRRQAADLRYILEAPKLKISKEEMVSIPIIERDYDRDSKSWIQKVRDRKRKPMPKSQSKDYLEDWLVWNPPRWERNPYFWVALTVWLTLVGVSLMFQD